MWRTLRDAMTTVVLIFIGIGVLLALPAVGAVVLALVFVVTCVAVAKLIFTEIHNKPPEKEDNKKQ